MTWDVLQSIRKWHADHCWGPAPRSPGTPKRHADQEEEEMLEEDLERLWRSYFSWRKMRLCSGDRGYIDIHFIWRNLEQPSVKEIKCCVWQEITCISKPHQKQTDFLKILKVRVVHTVVVKHGLCEFVKVGFCLGQWSCKRPAERSSAALKKKARLNGCPRTVCYRCKEVTGTIL